MKCQIFAKPPSHDTTAIPSCCTLALHLGRPGFHLQHSLNQAWRCLTNSSTWETDAGGSEAQLKDFRAV